MMELKKIMTGICIVFYLLINSSVADTIYLGWKSKAELESGDFENAPELTKKTKFYATYTDPITKEDVRIVLNAKINTDGTAVVVTWNHKIDLYSKKKLEGKQYSKEILTLGASTVQDIPIKIYADNSQYQNTVYLCNPLIMDIDKEGSEYWIAGRLFGPGKPKVFQEYYSETEETKTFGYASCKVVRYISEESADGYRLYNAKVTTKPLALGKTATGYLIIQNKIGITAGMDYPDDYDEFLTLFNKEVERAKAGCQFDGNQNRDAAFICRSLKAVNQYDNSVIWNDEKTHVLAVSWKSSGELDGDEPNWVDQLEIGSEQNNSYSPMFVTLAPELKRVSHKYKFSLQTESSVDYRLAQVLGMPAYIAENRRYKVFLEMWVKPEYLVRPSPDPGIADYEAEVNFSYADNGMITISSGYRNWFENKLIVSYDNNYGSGGANDPWPFTGFGYTYDWGQPSISSTGVSEFIISSPDMGKEGKYTVNRLVPTITYLTEDDDAYKTPGKEY